MLMKQNLQILPLLCLLMFILSNSFIFANVNVSKKFGTAGKVVVCSTCLERSTGKPFFVTGESCWGVKRSGEILKKVGVLCASSDGAKTIKAETREQLALRQ